MTLKQVGNLVKKKRIAHGFSYRELADITGQSTRTLQNIEKGDVNIGWLTLAVVCKPLGLKNVVLEVAP